MESRNISGGTKLFFGAPAQPMASNLAAAISNVVASIRGISEAHLPQCFIEGDTAARQVLVVVVPAQTDIPAIARELGPALKSALPAGVFIDMLPFRETAVPAGVREARCQIYPPQKNQ
jgi:SseB protein C-terminal domain